MILSDYTSFTFFHVCVGFEFDIMEGGVVVMGSGGVVMIMMKGLSKE